MRGNLLLFCLSAALYCVLLSAQPTGGGKDQGGKKGGTEAETGALLTSPDAVEAAVYKCASTDDGCPVQGDPAGNIARHFNQPFKTGEGKDTELGTALKAILKGRFRDEPVAPADMPWVVIHLVDRQDANLKERWVLAERKKGNDFMFAAGKRIMGSRRIGVVFIHVNAAKESDETMQDRYGSISYRAVIAKKLPANIQNLLSLVRLATSFQAAARAEPLAFVGFGSLRDVAVPSDVTVFGVDPGPGNTATLIGTASKYDNEGKYFWDASVGVPVNKLSLTEYSEESGSYLPKQINKQSVYGLVNLYPIPVDIKSGNLRWLLPRIVGGIGLTGRPGENFVIGGAWGIPQLQFFVGSGFANNRTLIPGKDPADPLSYKQRYASRLTYGLNIPVISAIRKVTAK